MILIDTNIIIELWKNPTQEFKSVLFNNDIFICGVVKSELLHGAKSYDAIDKILLSLSDFPEIPIYNEFWVDLGINLNKLKMSGLTVPFQDVMIATLAIKFKLQVWTLDKHFLRIAQILKELEIFHNQDE